jgi:uncharacterized protein (TIGR02145 family)
MKKIYILILSFILSFGLAQSQNDTMFIMKAGNVIGQFEVSEIDSVIFYKPTPQIDTFIDFRDGKTYKTVKIGDQWWMAENLAYDTGSGCWAYGNYKSNLEIYGYLYNWSAAKKACPSGWHLPSDTEWTKLEVYLQNNGYNYDGVETTGSDRTTHNRTAKSLASISGWTPSSVEGAVGNTDYSEYRNKSGFSALPGGYYNKTSGEFIDDPNIGNHGHWWTATESTAPRAWVRHLSFTRVDCDKYNFGKEHAFSVRCVRDN